MLLADVVGTVVSPVQIPTAYTFPDWSVPISYPETRPYSVVLSVLSQTCVPPEVYLAMKTFLYPWL